MIQAVLFYWWKLGTQKKFSLTRIYKRLTRLVSDIFIVVNSLIMLLINLTEYGDVNKHWNINKKLPLALIIKHLWPRMFFAITFGFLHQELKKEKKMKTNFKRHSSKSNDINALLQYHKLFVSFSKQHMLLIYKNINKNVNWKMRQWRAE